MLNLNRAQLIGNLTRDPEMRFTPNGQAVANFAVATNRKWKGRDGAADGEDTQYHDIVVWGKQAEAVVPMLKKGGPVFIEGRIETRNWEGQDSVKRYKTEIIADNIIVLGSRTGGGSYEPKSSAEHAPAEKVAPVSAPKNDEEIDIEEIPF
ncbi:MAG: single-stranded DNA-binding protein [Patescibacteria group bacterium]|jgi:single-strand DNA-binding protein